jgi:hypothetical protein
MGCFTASRRQVLGGLASFVIFAPAVVRASSLMGISARFSGSSDVTSHWPTEDALAQLQHEMERRFAESLFGYELSSAEAGTSLLARKPVAAEAKITALWELRTLFGPRGSPSKPLEDLPPEVRASLASMFGARAERSSAASAVSLSGLGAHQSDMHSI